MNHYSENRTKAKDKLSIYDMGNLLNFPVKVNNISSEIKALQRSIAIMKQDLPKILHDELIRLKGDI